MKSLLLAALSVFTIAFSLVWAKLAHNAIKSEGTLVKDAIRPTPLSLLIGFATNFLDTLGIGSFATTSSVFKLKRIVPDELIPGTMNVGHCLPTVVEAFIYISIIAVDPLTMVSMIAASILGAWFGAGIVSKWPRQTIQICLGAALFAAATLMFLSQMSFLPSGGDALVLTGTKLAIAVIGNFFLGALMTLGIGLYAPCMILVSLLGMNPKAAFPIMMGSCAFLMPVGSVPFIKSGRYNLRTALALSLGGIPGVLIAAFLVKSLPLHVVRWLVICVVLYTASMLIRSAVKESRQPGAEV
jgi:uncharacterized membrane protein YfcA